MHSPSHLLYSPAMSWKIKQKLRILLNAETNLCQQHGGRGGALSICLVYPNQYHTAMSSLGFQTVYRILTETADIQCERAFLPDREDCDEYAKSGIQLMSLETERPLGDFDILAFSTSFEPDYLSIPRILDMARIPPLSADRDDSHPLILAGGAAFFINPEPVADCIDAICIGEGEVILPPLLALLTSGAQGSRSNLLHALASLPGVYVPSLISPRYDQDGVCGFESGAGVPPQVVRGCSDPAENQPACSVILTEQTEFNDMFLIEVSRGCPRGCRFCTSGFIYAPFRYHPLEILIPQIDRGLQHCSKIGLVGAAVSDHPAFNQLCNYIVTQGGKVSVSSLRIDRIGGEALQALQQSGHKTISLAPEGGSQRLRDMIRKNLTREQILETCERLIANDILNLRLYFIIGLPTETKEDLDELVQLVTEIRGRVVERARANRRLGEIILSVNPFIPKPFTPFQWCGMEPLPSLEKKVKLLEQAFRPLSNVRLKVEGLKECYLQALLSRGDRRLTPLLLAMSEGTGLKKGARMCDIDTAAYVNRTIPLTAALPWDTIASGERQQLEQEYRRAFRDEEPDD